MLRDQLLQDPAPLFDRLGNVIIAIAPTSNDGNRLANNDLIAAITRSGDEEWIDGHARNLGENKRAIGQADARAEKMSRYFSDTSLHPIALNGDDFTETERIQQVE